MSRREKKMKREVVVLLGTTEFKDHYSYVSYSKETQRSGMEERGKEGGWQGRTMVLPESDSTQHKPEQMWKQIQPSQNGIGQSNNSCMAMRKIVFCAKNIKLNKSRIDKHMHHSVALPY